MLTDIIPATWRKAVYAIYALVAAAEGAMHTAYVTIGVTDPTWLLIALSVTAYVGVAIGAIAAANVPVVVPTRAVPATPAPVVVVPSVTANADGTITSVSTDGTVTKG